MRLIEPTDFDILEQFEPGRNVAANVAIEAGYDRPYVNTRVQQLHDYGLINRVGPSANSGLYELTNLGKSAISNRERYNECGPEEFERELTSTHA